MSPRPRRHAPGEVRRGLIAAGLELARSGGPEAVVLREATRTVGVAPNAAYRHFADRDALLNEVCVAAMSQLAARMEQEVARVSRGRNAEVAAQARLTAIGVAYLDFAATEPGLFETAFSVPNHLEYAADARAAGPGGRTAFELLSGALDELADAGVLPADRRPFAEFAVWSTVHGLAMLINHGPLRGLPSDNLRTIKVAALAYIARGL